MFDVRLVCILAVTLCCALPVSAQNEENPTVDLRFLFLDESLGEGYSVEVNDQFQKIGSYPYAISSPVSVPPGTQLNVYKDLPVPADAPQLGAGEKPEPQRAQVAKITAPGNTVAVLVVLRPTPGSQRYESTVYNSDPKAFPEGTVRVINLGSEPIGVALGDEMKLFNPGASGVIRPQPDHKKRVMTKVAVRNNTSMEFLYDSLIVMKPDDRVTGIVLYSPGGMRHTLSELEIQEFGEPQPRHVWRMYKD